MQSIINARMVHGPTAPGQASNGSITSTLLMCFTLSVELLRPAALAMNLGKRYDVDTSIGGRLSFLRTVGRNTTMTTLIPQMHMPARAQLSLSWSSLNWIRIHYSWLKTLPGGRSRICATSVDFSTIKNAGSTRFVSLLCVGPNRGCCTHWQGCWK